ncbi:MAG: UDP-N-acetylmuramoyl-L-alanine--D-glutamate ligase [Bacteroidia bacterium]|nr:UDP-N-acetylmuramoyl-L-alanine--D-glutamate ligase [Bacteroidia bacterium]
MSKIAILGAGESGVGTAILAKDKGFEVWLSDAKEIAPKYKSILEAENIPFEENGHTVEKFFEADIIMKSPGIPEKADIVKELRKKNKKIISEIEFAYGFTNAKIIAVTGSNGKTTTTSLIFHLMEKAGVEVGLGGNIGKSFAWQVARNPKPVYVLELSSFQLDDLETFRPDIAVLTNITEDHLDRYDYQLKKYAASKFNICRYQTANDIFIYNADDSVTNQEMPEYRISAQKQAFSMNENKSSLIYEESGLLKMMDADFDYSSMQIVGKHNAANTMAAILAVRAAGLTSAQIREHLPSFEPIEHRIEKVATVKGVLYINDSKATNVDSAWYALECMSQPVIWIAGGVDKGNDYASLIPLAEEKVKALIILGPYTEKLQASFEGKVPRILMASGMKEAIEMAGAVSESGDCVLLSPCCASFDLFKNYEDRGKQFKENVMNLR